MRLVAQSLDEVGLGLVLEVVEGSVVFAAVAFEGGGRLIPGLAGVAAEVGSSDSLEMDVT
jgi:hypothetical protein